MDESKNYITGLGALTLLTIITGAWIYSINPQKNSKLQNLAQLGHIINNPEGVTLPVSWNDLGIKLIKAGVIDKSKLEELYAERGNLTLENLKLLESANNGYLKITEDNAPFLLNLLWALGLGTKNDILKKGPMSHERYGGAGNFASTGGWTLAQGDAMDHFNQHEFIILTPEQQILVERVSKNIYRPCCNNSTYFPDCNHGMAMLGLLELMASQGINEDDMYKIALTVNSYWFKDVYKTIANYFEFKGIAWDKVDAKKVLGLDFSSGSGYNNIATIVEQEKRRASGLPSKIESEDGGGGCGV